MHIAIVTPKFVRGDGQGRVNVEVAECLLERGHRLTLLAQDALPPLVSHPRVTWIPLPGAAWPTALLRDAAMGWASARWLRAHRASVDLVVGNGCVTRFPVDVNAAHFVHHGWRVASTRITGRAAGLRGWYHALYTALNVRGERHAFGAARVVVAVSDRVRDELIEAGVSPSRIRVIPNGVDPDEFTPGLANRSALGLPPDVPLGLFVGDLQTPRKNLDTVLRALTETPGLHLAVAGRPEGSPYPDLAAELGLSGRVHFLGFRSDVADLMRASDLVVCPSRYEPFSLVVLEALASGRPVVTVRSVGAASLLTEACALVLADPDDAAALAGALSLLAGDPARRADMGRAGRQLALRYTWRRMAEQYADLFEHLSVPTRLPALRPA